MAGEGESQDHTHFELVRQAESWAPFLERRGMQGIEADLWRESEFALRCNSLELVGHHVSDS